MPSRLTSPTRTLREQDLRRAEALSTLRIVAAQGPWLGYVPDLLTYALPPTACRTMMGLIPRAWSAGGGEGELLMVAEGWIRVDSTDPPAELPLGSGANNSVVRLDQFERTNDAGDQTGDIYNTTIIAIVAGDGTTENTSTMYRLVPSSGAWLQVAHTNFGPAATVRPKADRDSLPDSATFAAGAPTRAAHSAVNGIDQPCFLWTNNIDPVYVYPADSNAGASLHIQYEDLTDDAGLDPFLCRSLEPFNNRVYFFNTSENGTRYRQRLRRTPPFTCDPLTTGIGAGSTDLKDFQGEGLRAERLGSVLALYFEDGVAFMRPTGVATAPDSFQTISTQRGLLGTHALTNLGNDLHFGIFTDGWFELDPSGRWKEVGLVEQGGAPKGKWKDTFYNLVAKDPAKRNRLYIKYLPSHNRVCIAIPTDTETDNEVVWVYDRTADRVFPDAYPVTCWGLYDRQVTTGLTYATSATAGVGGTPLTYATVAPQTYASVASQWGLRALAHGNLLGYVLQHEDDVLTRDRSKAAGGSDAIVYTYETHYAAGTSSRFLSTLDRVLLEYVNISSPNITVEVRNNPSVAGGAETNIVAVNEGEAGDLHTAESYFRLSGQQLNVTLSGTGPIMLKGFEADVFDELVEPPSG